MNARVRIPNKKTLRKKVELPSKDKKPAFSPSANLPVDQILHLQRTIGNQAVRSLIKSGALQAKLRIDRAKNIYGQEAERIAAHVMRKHGPSIQHKST